MTLDAKKPRLVVLTGAGISAESGLKTFRDSDGLWEGYNVYDVATPEAWHRNPEMVQNFYNLRRKAVLEAEPNKAHKRLAELEQWFDVTIITQNIDNLHERAGSSHVLHLHGEITKAQSTRNPGLVYDIDGPDLHMGQTCELGAQLRPFIVWFGEAVPKIEEAAQWVQQADVFVIIGTSLVVYPAAGLMHEVQPGAQVFMLDSGEPAYTAGKAVHFIKAKATDGVDELVGELRRSGY